MNENNILPPYEAAISSASHHNIVSQFSAQYAETERLVRPYSLNRQCFVRPSPEQLV